MIPAWGRRQQPTRHVPPTPRPVPRTRRLHASTTAPHLLHPPAVANLLHLNLRFTAPHTRAHSPRVHKNGSAPHPTRTRQSSQRPSWHGRSHVCPSRPHASTRPHTAPQPRRASGAPQRRRYPLRARAPLAVAATHTASTMSCITHAYTHQTHTQTHTHSYMHARAHTQTRTHTDIYTHLRPQPHVRNGPIALHGAQGPGWHNASQVCGHPPPRAARGRASSVSTRAAAAAEALFPHPARTGPRTSGGSDTD